MTKRHNYQTTIEWTGNLGSADPAFRGDKSRWNPEDMLLVAISACHKLWYLHFCAENHIVALNYCDEAEAVMDEGNEEQAGRFILVTLGPKVQISS